MGNAEFEAFRLRDRGPLASELPHVTVDRSARGAQPLSVGAGTGFEGVTQHGYIPGEPTCAAGPNQIFDIGNITVSITNKDGSGRTEVDGASFFGAPSTEGAVSDPLCFYDAMHGRFLALAFTQGSSPQYSNYYLAISKTSDARGDWWRYKFDMTKDGSTPTTNWSDFPGLGLSNDKIVMSGQQFDFSTSAYQYQKLRVIDRALAFSGGPVGYVDFYNFPAVVGGSSSSLFVTKPGRNMTPNDTVYCVSTQYAGGAYITFRTITGPPASPALSAGTRVLCSTYSTPANAAQQGTALLVNAGDCRTPEFHIRNGMLYIAWHFGMRFASPNKVNAIRYLKVRTGNQSLATQETFGADSFFYYYPALTVDSAGSVYMGFDRSTAGEYPSVWATGRRPADSGMEPAVLIKAGVTFTSQSRWGDYTGIDLDEIASNDSGSAAWYAGQWTKGTGTWGAWVNRLNFPYGAISGYVASDCDSSSATSGDRVPLVNFPVQLKQGASVLATAKTDATGRYRFGYLESGIYDVVPATPGGAVDASAGTGANSQTRISASDIQVNLSNTQSSLVNSFVVGQVHFVPAISLLTPSSRTAGDPGFTLQVDGSGFAACATVRLDGLDRTTTFVNSGRLTALIGASDVAAPGTRQITVYNPAGGVSAPIPLTVSAPPDLTPPAVQVTSPNGGEIWIGGSVHPVTWTATDSAGVDSVRIDYSLGGAGGAWLPVAHGLPNSGTYAWTVPSSVSDSALVRVKATDPSLNQGLDISDSLFSIHALVDTTPPQVTVTSPNGGEHWEEGSTHSITWTATDNSVVDSVSVDYTLSGPAGTWFSLAHGAPNTGTLSWVVPMQLSDSAMVRVTAFDPVLHSRSDTSDSLFSVVAPSVGVAAAGPARFVLHRPAPNPSHSPVRLGFSLARAGSAGLAVLDVGGRQVWTSAWSSLGPGEHEIVWSGRDDRGRMQPAGLYFVRLSSPSGIRSEKMIRLP